MNGRLGRKRVAQAANRVQRHDYAGFIAYLHHANQPRIRPQHTPKRIQLHRALRRKGNSPRRHAKAAFRLEAGILHRRMLCGGVKHLAGAALSL